MTNIASGNQEFVNSLIGNTNGKIIVKLIMQVSISLVTPPPGTPGFCTKMCTQPQGFCTTENARGPGQ